MKMKQLICLFAFLMMITGCDEVKKAANMADCKFEYNNITQVVVADVDIDNIDAVGIAKLLTLMGQQDAVIPMSCNLLIDVSNPNESTAAVSELKYNLSLDGIAFASGSRKEAVSIASGEKKTVTLPVNVANLALLLEDEASKEALNNLVKNFMGMGTKASKFQLDILPTITIAGIPFDSPAYIPVSFSFDGK